MGSASTKMGCQEKFYESHTGPLRFLIASFGNHMVRLGRQGGAVSALIRASLCRDGRALFPSHLSMCLQETLVKGSLNHSLCAGQEEGIHIAWCRAVVPGGFHYHPPLPCLSILPLQKSQIVPENSYFSHQELTHGKFCLVHISY